MTAETSTPRAFAGDKKEGHSLVWRVEQPLKLGLTALVPARVGTHHLTLMTIGWTAGVIGFAVLALSNPVWIWGISAMVIGQYLTDLIDGEVGRSRDTGLIKWGFFMDHLLDMVFSGAVVAAWALLAPAGLGLMSNLLLLATCAVMGLSFLSFAATNSFKIAFWGIGPTEVRLAYIGFNTALIVFGVSILSWAIPVLLASHVIALAVLGYQTHRKLWAMDMEAKAVKNAACSTTAEISPLPVAA